MPQLIQHIPIERDGGPTPQTLAPILEAAQPGTVTIVAADSSAASIKALFALTLELAKTQTVTFANFLGQEEKRNPENLLGVVNGLAGVSLGMSATELMNKLIRRQLTDAEYTALYALPLARIFVRDGFLLVNNILNGFPELSMAPDSGALVIDCAERINNPAWLKNFAKMNNLAVIAQPFVIRVARYDGSYNLIPELAPKSKQAIENADAVFVLHAERRR